MLPQSQCDNKMLLIPSSTTNQWPQKQIHIDDPKATPMDQKQPHQQQQQQQQQALKCPRCDSSNTKFCYYNNYSLSQPRHFCKACKRYWTRGGTLRNVPVGGGCRKNKRVKRPNNSATSSSSIIDHHVMPSTSSSNPNPNNIDLSSSTNHVNPLFYGLPTNPSELNLPFPRFNSRVSSTVDTGGYDLQPQMNALGLGFSSSGLIMGSEHHHVPNSNSILSSYPIFGSSTSSSTSPSMASLIASSLQQQRFMSLNSYDEESGNFGKEVKLEETANRLEWNFNTQNQIGQIGSSDPNSLVWNTSDVGAWLDPANMVIYGHKGVKRQYTQYINHVWEDRLDAQITPFGLGGEYFPKILANIHVEASMGGDWIGAIMSAA